MAFEDKEISKQNTDGNSLSEAGTLDKSRLFAGIDAYISKHYVAPERAEENANQTAKSFIKCRLFPGMLMGRAGEAKTSKSEPSAEIDQIVALESKESRSLDDCIRNLDKSFMEMVFYYADMKGLSDGEVERRSNLDRKLFSKLRCGTSRNPSKSTALALTIGLSLNLDDAKDLLARAGYALSPCSRQDLIVQYFIEAETYDIDVVNEALYEHGEPLLGSVRA